jgi:HK97 family phage prohead protease
METKFKEFVVESKALDDGSYEAVITTSAKDRQGEIVVSTGMDVGNYMKNPIVLFAHDYASPPVARAISLTTSEAGITARFVFPEKGVSVRADEIHALWDAHFLNAVSIGFLPQEWAQDATDPTITKAELLEFSIVPVPANQEALRLALEQAQVALKEGRVLSKSNRSLVQSCVDSLTALLEASDKSPSGDGQDEGKAWLEELHKQLTET